VKRGEDVIITEQGKMIASIINENPQKASLRQALYPLILQGLITLPTNQIDKDVSVPVEIPGKPVSEMSIEDRR
jgi:antitoxin (DNA-binding transcriptional repressor) of toxin-antitoxin stability system